jgi:hypothetical protein
MGGAPSLSLVPCSKGHGLKREGTGGTIMSRGLIHAAGRPLGLLVVCLAILLAASCATQPPPVDSGPPGFLRGLLHGFLIVFGFIGSLFSDYRIYAFPNSGVWYDLGYLLGAMAFLGGGGAGTCQRAR